LLRHRGRRAGSTTGGGLDHQKKDDGRGGRGRIGGLRAALRGRGVRRLRLRGGVRLAGRSAGRCAVVGRALDRRVNGAYGRRGRPRTPRSPGRRLHPHVAPATAAQEAVRRRRRVETEEAAVQQEREQ